jgi:hypothetical protein
MKTLAREATLSPLYASKIKNFDLLVSTRTAAINLMIQMEKVWKQETFAVLPQGGQYRLCNYSLLSPADRAWIDYARSNPEYYEEI